jgi:hypothetical protein
LERTLIIGLLLFFPTNRLTTMACFAAAAGVYFFFHGFQLLARRHQLEQIPESSIRGLSEGPASVSGVATGPYTLSGPITGEPCYLYQTTVWQQDGPDRQREWKKVAEETLHLPFYIEDATGHLLVEPFGAALDLHQNLREEYDASLSPSSSENIPQRVSGFLARQGIFSDRPTRVEEWSIQPNTPVFIAGTITENPGIPVRPISKDEFQVGKDNQRGNTKPGDGGPQHEIIRLASGPAPSSTIQMTQQGKIAAALSRAGITKPEAWAAAGVSFPANADQVAVEERTHTSTNTVPHASAITANQEANGQSNRLEKDGQKSDSAHGFDLAPPFVLMKGADNSAFVISCHSQPEVVSSLGWKSVGLVVVGAFLSVLGLYVLLLDWQVR